MMSIWKTELDNKRTRIFLKFKEAAQVLANYLAEVILKGLANIKDEGLAGLTEYPSRTSMDNLWMLVVIFRFIY
ncbi:MAG: hypothetical protein VR69_00600 [Peptococcaceae bacterium BRH_c4b]|nr:MAG: hypothetical protein VR69_00600 [Peptococcaceae bacterium BRH_c4b]